MPYSNATPSPNNWANSRSENTVSDAARELFRNKFGYEPEGVWAAPGRVNLIGEHVDYAGGICLPFALQQCAYMAVSRNELGQYRLCAWDVAGPAEEYPVTSIAPGNPPGWAGYVAGAVWAADQAGLLSTGNTTGTVTGQGFDLALVSDVPVGAGLSSSAAIECSAAVAAVELMTGEQVNEAQRVSLVAVTMRAENEIVGASTGGLDQKISLLGETGNALAIDFGNDNYRQIPFDIARQGLAVLVTNTNSPHSLADGQYASRRGVIDAVTQYAGAETLRQVEDPYYSADTWAETHAPEGVDIAEWRATVHRRIRHQVTEIERTETAITQLETGNFKAFGESMQQSHISLRHDYEVSTPELDTVVEISLAHGALGARMTGGGFGGSAIALLDAQRITECADAIAEAFAWRSYPVPEFIAATPSLGARRTS
ncbi:MAG: galactokinase [Varibaculum sp.]|nr:galactokinase [Varibaculum sp.]